MKIMISKLWEHWDRFWFSSRYSRETFVFYRFMVFGAMVYMHNPSTIRFFDCEIWSPIGIISFLNIPCDENIFQWAGYVAPVAASLAALGILYNWTSKIAFAALLIQFGISYSFGKVGNSFHLIIMSIGILSLIHIPRGKPLMFTGQWQLQLIKLYIVWVYLGNGLAKLINGGLSWGTSENMFLLLQSRPYLGVLGHWLSQSPIIYSTVFAFIALFITEIAAPLALLSSRLGITFFFIWAGFHIGVTLIIGGHTEFYTQIIVNMIFLPLDKIANWFVAPQDQGVTSFSVAPESESKNASNAR